jgi:hypothetical protein
MRSLSDKNFAMNVKLSNSGEMGILYGTGNSQKGVLQIFDTNYKYDSKDVIYGYSSHSNNYINKIEIGKPIDGFKDVNAIPVKLNNDRPLSNGYLFVGAK